MDEKFRLNIFEDLKLKGKAGWIKKNIVPCSPDRPLNRIKYGFIIKLNGAIYY
jgi:hypothetical protein